MVSHAGVSPSVPISDQINTENYHGLHDYILKKHLEPMDSFIWVRDQFFNAAPELWSGHIVVHGHTPVNKLRRFVDGDHKDEWEFFNGDICIRRDPVSKCPVSIDIDSGSTISGRLSGLGMIVADNKIKMHSITVSADEIIRRELGDF
jgi:hypothetical protein